MESTLCHVYSGMNWRSPSMSRWMLDREREQQKRNALLLLMLSGVIRPADVGRRYFSEGTTGEQQSRPGAAVDPITEAVTSIWSMDLKQLLEAYPRRLGRTTNSIGSSHKDEADPNLRGAEHSPSDGCYAASDGGNHAQWCRVLNRWITIARRECRTKPPLSARLS